MTYRPTRDQFRIPKPSRTLRGTGEFVQVRPSSGLRYPQLELGRWYVVLRTAPRGCFVAVDSGEMFLEQPHYIVRRGTRGADRQAGDGATPDTRMVELAGEGTGG